jgi:ATP-dependent exoDNAse (exonuclease V) beta subunit
VAGVDAVLDGLAVGQLGEEARDAIDAILDQALAFEAANAPSLQGFLAWIDADDLEIKRDPDAPLDAIRLMTVHGAKGLQAPVVILARLAVSRQDQGRGMGFGLLQDAIRRTMLIAEQAGIRAMLTHPIDEEAAKFYTRFGFIASPLREQQLLLLLKDARRWAR